MKTFKVVMCVVLCVMAGSYVCVKSAGKVPVKKLSQSELDDSLFKAAQGGDVNALTDALAAGAKINAVAMDHSTPLIVAAKYSGYEADGSQKKSDLRNETIVRVLAGSDGADINAKDTWGHTALYWAALNDNVPAVKILLDAKAKRDIKGLYNRTFDDYLKENQFSSKINELFSTRATIKPLGGTVVHDPYAPRSAKKEAELKVDVSGL